MSYIYEMDVTQLRISYILPVGLTCFKIATTLYNWHPYDRSNMNVRYEAHITGTDDEDENSFFVCVEGENLQELPEKVRIHFKNNPYKQSTVEKSLDDGTDSVISTS